MLAGQSVPETVPSWGGIRKVWKEGEQFHLPETTGPKTHMDRNWGRFQGTNQTLALELPAVSLCGWTS